MVSTEIAARLIAGMIQCTKTIGPLWDRLSGEEISILVKGWQRAIETSPEQATEHIVRSIADHPFLKTAWSDLGDSTHQNRALIIRAIITNTNVP